MTLNKIVWMIGCTLGMGLLASLGSAAPPRYRYPEHIETVTMTRLDQPAQYVHVVARGYGFLNEWELVGAHFGTGQKVLAFAAFPDGKGFSGLLPPDVPDGAHLTLEFKNQSHRWIDHYFQHKDVKGVARRSLDQREDCAFPVVDGESLGDVRLGMTVAELQKLQAKGNHQSAGGADVGGVRVIIKDGKVSALVRDSATACFLEGGQKRKVDLEFDLPYPDCGYGKTVVTIGGPPPMPCGGRGVHFLRGDGDSFPEIRVVPRGTPPEF